MFLGLKSNSFLSQPTGVNDLMSIQVDGSANWVCDASNINSSVQRCTELFLEAKLLPASWMIIMSCCLNICRLFAIQVTQPLGLCNLHGVVLETNGVDWDCLSGLQTQFSADAGYIPFILNRWSRIYTAINHALLPSLGITWDSNGAYVFPPYECLSKDDPLHSYAAMKCILLDSLDMELCHLVNQYVMDNNRSVRSISEEYIIDNIHNPFINQYDYLFAGTYIRTEHADSRKRKLVEQDEQDKKTI